MKRSDKGYYRDPYGQAAFREAARHAQREYEVDAAVREGLRRADFHWMMYSGCCAQACLDGIESYRGFVRHHVEAVWREQHR